MILIPLTILAFAAGFVDAVAGGGGLIQLPALFLFLPPHLSTPVASVLGTNKLSSICGTSMAAAQYVRRVPIPWQTVGVCAGVALVSSLVGARAVSVVPSSVLKPMVLGLLVVVAGVTIGYKHFGTRPRSSGPIGHPYLRGAVLGLGIGFYDGFFGPGTGTVLVMGFVGLLGMEFLEASAAAKVVNLATNFSAVVYFAASGLILYEYAVPMAICNVVGALIGSRMAILKGNQFVRWCVMGVVMVLIARFGWEVVRGR